MGWLHWVVAWCQAHPLTPEPDSQDGVGGDPRDPGALRDQPCSTNGMGCKGLSRVAEPSPTLSPPRPRLLLQAYLIRRHSAKRQTCFFAIWPLLGALIPGLR